MSVLIQFISAGLLLMTTPLDTVRISPESVMFQTDRLDLLIPDIEDTFGAAFRDIDGDRYPDLYVVCYRSLNRLLVNRGDDLGFRDETVVSGLGGNLMPMAEHNVELNAVILDVDNDGDGDVIIAGHGFTTKLFINEGGLKFIPDDSALDLPDYHYTNQVIGADVNMDGYLDLFFVDEELTNRLLLNTGYGRFKDATASVGLEGYDRSFGAAFGDLDGDGAPDLYVANDNGPDYLYKNKGDGSFKRMYVPLRHLQSKLSSTAVCMGDVDNDGDLDLFVAGPDEEPAYLLINQIVAGDTVWHFDTQPVGSASATWDGVFADFDNDGWLDMFVAHHGANRYYKNYHGTLRCAWTESLSSGQSAFSTGVLPGDYDRDGDLDLFIANRDTFSLFYSNPVNNDNYLKVSVEGVRSNRDGIGSAVRIYRATGSFNKSDFLAMREIGTGGGYLSLTSSEAHFGLAGFERVDVEVQYPGGRVVRRIDVSRGQEILISEYVGITRQFFFFIHRISVLLNQRSFWRILILSLVYLATISFIIFLGIRRYKWSALTATLSMAFFFFTAYGIILTSSELGAVKSFILLDIVTLFVGTALILHFERILRLHRAGARDRAVLVALSHQIVEIRNESDLARIVVTHLAEHSDFSGVAVFLAEQESVDALLESKGFGTIDRSWLEESLEKCRIIGGGRMAADQYREVEWMLPIGRDEYFFGLLLLGHRSQSESPADEDRDLFSSIVSQMAIALENIAYINKSNEMIQKLTEAEVREQYLAELESSNMALDEKNRELIRLYDELKQAETQLIQREKMASLGQLVAGIAHELNNPVGFIYANIRQLKTYLKPIQQAAAIAVESTVELNYILPDLESLIEDTVRGSIAVKALVENLRTFSHLDQAEMTETNVHEGIETSLIIASPQLKDRISIIKDYQAVGRLEAHPGQLNQVFLNLIINAAQAIDGEGSITLRTRDESDMLIIEVEDTGPGIPEAVRDKIFDPFFSTKEIGQGMGMGLSISYAIIEKHGGSISVDSEPGRGSVFRINLPRDGVTG
ncbi:VCBS repeat-containing protein [bacterium]|nr:VCBS repeat-containing protein [bacterium]